MIVQRLRSCQYCSKTGSTLHCARCKLVHYCGRKCQTDDWPEHKKICNTETAKLALVSNKLFGEIIAIDNLQMVLVSYLMYRTSGDTNAGHLEVSVRKESIDDTPQQTPQHTPQQTHYTLLCRYYEGNPDALADTYNIQLWCLVEGVTMTRWLGVKAKNSANMKFLHEIFKDTKMFELIVTSGNEPRILMLYKDSEGNMQSREVV